jgi:hypothetical protein
MIEEEWSRDRHPVVVVVSDPSDDVRPYRLVPIMKPPK